MSLQPSSPSPAKDNDAAAVSSDWIAELQRRLSEHGQPPLTRRYKSAFSPSLSYGRHRGPIPKAARRAAVLIALEPREEVGGDPLELQKTRIILTRRPTALKHHGGQVCLPGGQLESGETSLQAALREFQEELGRSAELVQPIGRLSTQYVYASDNQVVPHVVCIHHAQRPWRPDPAEVDQVLEIPVADLLKQHADAALVAGKQIKKVRKAEQVPGRLEFSAPAFQLDNSRIWGATAMILDELAYHLHHVAGMTARPAN